ncbi:MAG: hypothetical protein SH859_15030 [Hyphomicrobium aestuarii]|nr:hypothetical protein [Hyphomicrobium aestuarii]
MPTIPVQRRPPACGRTAAIIAFATAVLTAVPGDAAAQRSPRFDAWGSINDKRYGFQLAYPADVLMPIDTPSGAEGRVLQSADGKAKLLVATFINEQKLSLDAYRQFLLDGNYAGTKIDYAPQRNRWFVLSGERGEFTFYERVTFSCGGELINSWAMIYPTAQKKLYDRVVDIVHKTYAAGAGPRGDCVIPEQPSDSQSNAPADRDDDGDAAPDAGPSSAAPQVDGTR